MTKNLTPVTVVGLGDMGRALAAAFLDAGHPTTVWNRTPHRADDLVRRGATRAATAADAVRASRVVVVCLLDYPTVREVLAPAGGELAGRTVVNLTNGTPAQAAEAGDWVRGLGADYLDGGIMAIPPMIGQPGALILYSGSKGAYEAERELLERLGGSRFLGTDPGAAALHDLALLAGMYGLFGGFLHAVAMVDGPARGFTDELLVPWLTAMTGVLPELADQIDAGKYTAQSANLAMQAVSLANITTATVDRGVDPALLAPLRALADRRVSEGSGGDDISTLVEGLRVGAR
ncbi:imine reductase family protein [Phytohabitans houttuyneae]|uniref:6-phosphogluconate dehydrogenase n=1 Tax=Phytohabitans houttuyneae TaxID=1076126 RepID=A0A6V8K480_9ACTN|nr:NAD(P)-binding domain-containing protein [Phytohabitans houttuyneae]GFJ77108.1 6-phosphogluconate dehydrogenase [Phytohabitans houttuyneae]